MYFKDDYSIGAHPAILEEIIKANDSLEDSYQLDGYSLQASELIRKEIDRPDAFIRFVSGGTLANLLVIGAALKDYESVIAVESGHINLHETGAVEYTGHKINPVKGKNGKIGPAEIREVLEMHNTPPHMVKPKMVYISQSTELGTIYTKKELEEISRICKKNDLYLFLDGARLGNALMSKESDMNLTDIVRLTDAFYLGGTKNGGLMGEAIIITHEDLKKDFDFHLKQKGALPAKTRFFGAQFIAFFKNALYYELAAKANSSAQKLDAILRHKGIKTKYPTQTNQVFPVLPNTIIEQLKQKVAFYVWEKVDENNSVIRLVTSWKTKESELDNFDEILDRIM